MIRGNNILNCKKRDKVNGIIITIKLSDPSMKNYLYEVLTSLWLIKTSSISEGMCYDGDDGALIGNWCKTNLAPTPNTFYINTYISYRTFEKAHTIQ